MFKIKPIRKAILLADTHHDHHSIESLKLVNAFLKDEKPDYLVYMGDMLDMDVVSYFAQGKPRLIEGKRLKTAYDKFDEDILSPHEKIVGKKCKKIYIMGNHEYRIQTFLDEHPEGEGILEPENYLKLKERGWEVIPYATPKSFYQLGKLILMHGYCHPKYHASKVVTEYVRNVIYGHVHTPQSFFHNTAADQKDFHSAHCLPCLSDTNPEWLKGKPNSWVNGFGIVYFFPNGDFTFYPIYIVNNRFIWNGKIYQ